MRGCQPGSRTGRKKLGCPIDNIEGGDSYEFAGVSFIVRSPTGYAEKLEIQGVTNLKLRVGRSLLNAQDAGSRGGDLRPDKT
jgi:hypothetical protein